MGRIARLVIPGCPHHLIQRGNRRQPVFFSDGDKAFYLTLLCRRAKKLGIDVWAFCLMDNHTHLVAVPRGEDSFALWLGEVHRRYTLVINTREDWKGYLWQGRFISYPLEDSHLYATIRYVERNPVRAGIVTRAEAYEWSSACAHVLGEEHPLLSPCPLEKVVMDWSAYLGEKDRPEDVKKVLQSQRTGRPLGGEEFLRRLETLTGRVLLPRKKGRKKKMGE